MALGYMGSVMLSVTTGHFQGSLLSGACASHVTSIKLSAFPSTLRKLREVYLRSASRKSCSQPFSVRVQPLQEANMTMSIYLDR